MNDLLYLHGLVGGAAAPSVSTGAWVRNPSWTAFAAPLTTDHKFVGLHKVNQESNFVSLSAAGAYTVDWGDGTTPENYATGVQCYHEYDYTAVGLLNTNAPVTLTDVGDLVTRTAHGYTNGMRVAFYNLVSTTGIVATQVYYVVNATANTFQVSATSGGAALALTTDGTATLLPYKQAVVTVTMQAAQTFTALNLFLKHNKAGLNSYATGWLDIAVAGSSLASLTIAAGGTTVQHGNLEKVNVVECSASTLSFLFANCYKLQSVVDVNTTATSGVDMSYMLNSCSSLQTIPLLNTAAVTSMSYMLGNCSSLQTIPLLNTAAVTDMSGMLSYCSSLQTIPLLNTAAVTSMSGMFSGCYSLQTIPLLNTAAVTSMSGMFGDCPSLQTIPLLNTAAVTDMNYMFSYCYSLQTIPLLNTAAVTDMSGMFIDCYSLQTIPPLNTAAVTSTIEMVSGCTSLSKIEATGFAVTFSVEGCKLSAASLDLLYTNLATVTAETLTVSTNHGVDADDPTIATAKGWTITG